jgi:pimeloyl-ACP methyl ester carboxylesterase
MVTVRAKRTIDRAEASYRALEIRGATYFRSRVAFDDLTIFVKRFPVRGPVDGPTFVLVHGVAVSSRYFTPTAAELAQFGTVYLVDLPGHGDAPDPKRDVTIADHAAVLAKFIAGADLHNPVIVGHSAGSQIVSRLAVDSPEVADHIVLMAPTMPADARTWRQSLWRLFVDGLREPIRVTIMAAGDYLVRCGVPFGIHQVQHVLDDHIEDRLGEIRANTLVLIGDHDPIVPVSWAQRVADGVPGGILEVVRGPHVVMHTDPVTVARHIAEHANR